MSRLDAYLPAVVFSVLAGAAALPRATAQPAASPPSPEATVIAYCAAWNTTDRAERERLLAQSWAPDGVYADPEPTLAAGRAALSEAIADFQRRHPGARFRCSVPQAHHGAMRVTWICRWPDGRELSHGTDFSELGADGRIRRLVGFFGAPPVVGP